MRAAATGESMPPDSSTTTWPGHPDRQAAGARNFLDGIEHLSGQDLDREGQLRGVEIDTRAGGFLDDRSDALVDFGRCERKPLVGAAGDDAEGIEVPWAELALIACASEPRSAVDRSLGGQGTLLASEKLATPNTRRAVREARAKPSRRSDEAMRPWQSAMLANRQDRRSRRRRLSMSCAANRARLPRFSVIS